MNETKNLRAVIHAMHPRKVFRISRAARVEVENVFVEISGGAVKGYGEASPNAYYGETASDVLARVIAAGPLVASLKIDCPNDLDKAWHEVWRVVAPSRAAQCAIDLALWDWLAKRNGVSVSQMALEKPLHPVKTFCTVGISDSAELEEKIAELRGFPLIKIKSDAQADLAPIRMVSETTNALLAVDANCAWGGVDIGPISRELSKHRVAFIEQPLPPALDDTMPAFSAASELPIFADESCVCLADVEHVTGRFAGFNIKLVKCGGLTPALAMWRRGRELGLHTMVGCMLESSLLISAGAVVAQETEYADLDGAWLLADDPFAGGLPCRNGVLTPNPASDLGFGVEPADVLKFQPV